MASEPTTITVEAGSEIDRLLDEAAGGPVRLVRNGERFRLVREDDDIWTSYDPERAIAGRRAAAGSWSKADADRLKEYIYRAREEGTRPPDRP